MRQYPPTRLVDKDAHGIYRILVAIQTEHLAVRLRQLQTNGLAGQVTNVAIDYLKQLFAAGPGAIGSLMAGRAETGVGDPEVVLASVAALSEDPLRALGALTDGKDRQPCGPVLARRLRETVFIDDNC
jgi:hypothetical protein